MTSAIPGIRLCLKASIITNKKLLVVAKADTGPAGPRAIAF